MNKRIIAVLGAALLALLAVVAMVVYAQGADERARKGAEAVNVLQATTDIPAGTPASKLATMVKLVQVPRANLIDGAVENLDALSGQLTTTALVVGDQITTKKFNSPDKIDSPTIVPRGLQSLSIPLSSDRALGGKLKVGDEVGIIISYGSGSVVAAPINQVLVVGVDSGVLGGAEGGSGNTITVAVNTETAEKITHALEFGNLRLTLQNDSTNIAGGRTIKQEDIAS